MIEYFAMGGHGFYIWTAYFISAVVIGLIGVLRYKRLSVARKKDRANTTTQEKP